MLRVEGAGLASRDTRYPYPGRRPAHMRDQDGQILAEAEVRDVSASGAALNTDVPFENGHFVQVHIEGLGHMAGNVARAYDGGVAVKFQDRQDEDRVSTLNRLA